MNGVVLLVRNPETGRVLPINEENTFLLACWPSFAAAAAAAADMRLVKAWGGYAVNLDTMEVRPL